MIWSFFVAFALKMNAIVLLDPVTEWGPVVQAAKQKNLVAIAVQLSPIEDRMKKFLPTPEALKEAGVDHVLDLQDRDCYNCVYTLQLLQLEENLSIQAVIPLAETAVDYSDVIGAMLGLAHHNPLHLATSRRDKGFMKETVQKAGIRVATFARIQKVSEIENCIQQLQLDDDWPIVVKTPQGFSSTDVYICESLNDAKLAAANILDSVGPEGRRVSHALIEKYIGGTEFAVNLMAFGEGNLTVTDVWKYVKTDKARYSQAENCDPNDAALKHVVEYSKRVAQAVGLRYGAGHVEVKATRDDGIYVDPCMMEVGARLSGGRKATMTQAAMGGSWDPFSALIDSHSGVLPSFPPSFTPKSFVRHLFLPIESAGCIEEVQLDVTALTTLHSRAMIVKKGDVVKETTDITSCAGFLWFVGDKKDVAKDTERALSTFLITMTGASRLLEK